MTPRDYKKLRKAQYTNAEGRESDMFLALDHVGQSFLGMFGDNPTWLKPGCNIQDARAMASEIGKLLGGHFRDEHERHEGSTQYPSRHDFRDTLVEMHSYYNPDDTHGQWFRRAIVNALEVLEMNPIQERIEGRTPSVRPHGR